MSLEVEVKVYASDLKGVERKLQTKGAVHLDEIEQSDIYFSSPHHDFERTDEALRLRVEREQNKEKRYFLTYKGPKIDEKSKTRVEVKVRIDSIPNAEKLLSSLGFEEFGRVNKQRKRYELDDLEVCLDDVEGLGCFIEVESMRKIPLNTHELATERDRIIELLNDLSLERFERASYLELLYLSKKGKN